MWQTAYQKQWVHLGFALNMLICVLNHIACEKFKAELSQLKVAMFSYIHVCSMMILCCPGSSFWWWCDIFNFVGAMQHVDITFLELEYSVSIFISFYFPGSIWALNTSLITPALNFMYPLVRVSCENFLLIVWCVCFPDYHLNSVSSLSWCLQL